MPTLVLRAAWSSDITGDGDTYPDDGSDYCGGDGGSNYRVAAKFDIATLSAIATVTQVDFSVNVESVVGASALLWDIGPYGGTGFLGDPETDDAVVAYGRCNVSADLYVDDTTQFRTTGVKSFTNLGLQAIADVTAARDAGTVFSLGIMETTSTSGGNNRAELSEYSDATAGQRPTLTITYELADFSAAASGAGGATVAAIGAAIAASSGLAAGLSSVTAIGAAVAASSGLAAGSGAAAGATSLPDMVEADGSAAGSSACIAEGAGGLDGGGDEAGAPEVAIGGGGGFGPGHRQDKQRFRTRKDKSRPKVITVRIGDWPEDPQIILGREEDAARESFYRQLAKQQPPEISSEIDEEEQILRAILEMAA